MHKKLTSVVYISNVGMYIDWLVASSFVSNSDKHKIQNCFSILKKNTHLNLGLTYIYSKMCLWAMNFIS